MTNISGLLGRYGLRLVVCSVAVALMGASAATAAAKRSKHLIPKAFQGEWYTEPQTCGHDSMEAFVIRDTTTESGEDDGAVVTVKVLSPTHIVVTTDEMGEATADTPPGIDPSAGRLTSDYQLSDKGKKLKIKFGTRDPMTYTRCTKAGVAQTAS